MQKMVDEAEGLDEADDLVEQIMACTNSPLDFVRLTFPDITPERWQAEVLKEVGDQLEENARLGRFKPIQIGICSGNGIGKSTLMSWIILWTLITFEDSIGVATAGSEAQLRVRLWGELARQFAQLPDELRTQFELAATAIYSKQNNHTWRVDARAWSPLNQESFSGVHAYRRRVLVVYDEASMIAEPIWRATDGMLNDAETQTIWIVAGNGVRLDGRFRQCFPGQKFAGLWKTYSVDSREVSLTSKEAIAEKIEFYGVDSNYVRVHVRGLFPTASAMGLIPADVVEAAAAREPFTHPADPVLIGVDPASGHSTDAAAIVVRKGLDAKSYPIWRSTTTDPIALAYEVMRIANEVSADAIFVDQGGLGEGTVSRLRELGAPVHGVFAAGKSNGAGDVRCGNMRAQCWTMMAAWLRAGAIPRDATLMAELTTPEVSEGPLGLLIEKKEHVRERLGGSSTDSSDALSLTFAYPIFTQLSAGLTGRGDHQVVSDWDPFSPEAMAGKPYPELKQKYIAPGWPKMRDLNNPADWAAPDAGPGEWAGDGNAEHW
jgi:hypothetical protein